MATSPTLSRSCTEPVAGGYLYHLVQFFKVEFGNAWLERLPMSQPTFELAMDLCASKRCARKRKLVSHAPRLEDVLKHVSDQLRKPGLGDAQGGQVRVQTEFCRTLTIRNLTSLEGVNAFTWLGLRQTSFLLKRLGISLQVIVQHLLGNLLACQNPAAV